MRKAILFVSLLTSVLAIAQTEAPDTISTRLLNEVVVKGEKPQVRGEDGILTVDLPGLSRTNRLPIFLKLSAICGGDEQQRYGMAYRSVKCHHYS